MSASPDVHWHQRLDHFQRALSRLRSALDLREDRGLSELEAQGSIQAFEYTFELTWNTIRDFYLHQGEERGELQGSRDAFRLAFQREFVEDGGLWMDMIQSRQLTSHTYDEATAAAVIADISNRYAPALERLAARLEKEREG